MTIFVVMNKSQLDNLIHFCANFHKVHVKIEDQNVDYILEKWNKYIGVEPIKNDNLPSANDISKNYPLRSGDLVRWFNRWGKNGNYDKVKEILNFILITNTKFFSRDDRYNWTPSELIEIFKNHIGDPEKINTDKYQFLHELVMRSVHDEWLYSDRVNRDYKLCLLVNDN